MSSNISIQNVYNKMYKTYDDMDDDSFYLNQYDSYNSFLNSFYNYLNGNVLDIGCGTGIQIEYLSNFRFEIYGIDISYNLLLQAKNKLNHHSNVYLIKSDANCLPFKTDYFNNIISYGEVISHIDNYQLTFQEINRVLKVKGLLSFSVLTSFFQRYKTWSCKDDDNVLQQLTLKTFTKKEILGLLPNYKLIKHKYIFHNWFPYISLYLFQKIK